MLFLIVTTYTIIGSMIAILLHSRNTKLPHSILFGGLWPLSISGVYLMVRNDINELPVEERPEAWINYYRGFLIFAYLA